MLKIMYIVVYDLIIIYINMFLCIFFISSIINLVQDWIKIRDFYLLNKYKINHDELKDY